MPDGVTVNVSGLKPIVDRMKKLVDSKIVDQTLEDYAEVVRLDVTPYPPESEANAPPPPYYMRGQGTVTAAGVRRTSQDMGRKWHVNSSSRLITLRNEATYSGWVQGADQVGYHAARGWKNAVKRAEEMLPQLQDIFSRLFQKAGL